MKTALKSLRLGWAWYRTEGGHRQWHGHRLTGAETCLELPHRPHLWRTVKIVRGVKIFRRVIKVRMSTYLVGDVYKGLIVNAGEEKCITAPGNLGNIMKLAPCDPADPKQMVTVNLETGGGWKKAYNLKAADVPMRVRDRDVYWDTAWQSGDEVSFDCASLEGNTATNFNGKYGFYGSGRKDGRDISAYWDQLTQRVGVDGSPASTWLPYELWQACKEAGMKATECTKGRYDLYLKHENDEGSGTSGWETGGNASPTPAETAATTSPPAVPFWDQPLLGYPRKTVVGVGSVVAGLILGLVFLIVLKATM